VPHHVWVPKVVNTPHKRALCGPSQREKLCIRDAAITLSKRGRVVLGWLKATGKNCSLDRLILIRNNRVQWLGSADSAAVAGEIDQLIELALKDDAGALGQLYRSPEPASAPAAKP
jgi:hypothetical protein